MPDELAPAVKNPKKGFAIGWLRLSGLQGKLIIPYVILTMLLAMIGIFVVTRLVASSFRERFANQLYAANLVAQDNFVRQEQTHLEQLRLMAFTQGVSEALAQRDPNTLSELLLPLALNEGMEVITAVDLDSPEVLTLGEDPATGQYLQSRGNDLSSLGLVQKVLDGVVDAKGDKFTQLVETPQGPALFTSAPVRDASGKLSGVLLLGTRLQSLLADTKTQALADLVILDGEMDLLQTTLAEPAEGFSSLKEAAQPFVADLQIDPQEVRLYNRDFKVYYQPFELRGERLGWLGTVLPTSYVASTEATSRNTFILLFSLGTVAVIIIGYILSQTIARPILRLRSLSQAVAAGDLNQQSGLKQSDEIGELASAMDVMTLQLRERTEEAERLYAETLQRNKELAEINAKLQAAQQQLIQSEKLAAIGQLTAGIVHDVKNPLTVIKGSAELLQDESQLSDEELSIVMLIRESSEKANRIVSDLLKFARQSAPEKNFQDLRETLEAALRLTAYQARHLRVQVIQDIPAEPVMLTYDAQQIEQVFVNMINNAIQATPAHGSLRVNIKNQDGMVATTFEDTGIGIPPEIINRIFDPFFTTKPEGEGTGLGLSVSYGIVSSHRGRIEVESVVGQGTTFTILLPQDQNHPSGAS
jgi:two-component system NtrC family sensor kinase